MLGQYLKSIFFKMGGKGDANVTCPDPELIAAYIDKTLSSGEEEELEKHFIACNACLALAIDSAPVAEDARQQAKWSPAKVIIRFLQDSVEVFSSLADVMILSGAAPCTLRTDARPNRVVAGFSRSFGKFTAEFTITKHDQGYYGINVRLLDDDRLVDDARISLIAGGVEQESHLTVNGEVFLEARGIASCILTMKKGGDSIGEIAIDIRDASD